MRKIVVGTWVKLRKTVEHPGECPDGQNAKIAQVRSFYPDIDGGARLSVYLGAFQSWNVADLVAVKRPTP